MQYNPYTPAATKKYEIEKKSKKYKNIYDELCQITEIREIGVLDFFLIFCRNLPGFFCLTVLPGTCREHEEILTLQGKHQNFLVRYLAGDLPGILFLPTCRDLPDR